jgi:aspartate/methionine/tyrosine aminotransferase
VIGPINPDLHDTATPPIPEARGWLEAYDGRHGPPINLAQAVPGAPPPELLARLAAAAGNPETARYGPITGDPALVAAYAEGVREVYGAAPSPAEIAITSGCNEAFFVTVLALAKAGEAILLPTPWYFNHAMTLRMLGIMALPLPTHAARGFVADPEEADALLTRHAQLQPGVPVRALVLVTPNNPTGAIAPPTVIHAFADLAARHRCWLVLDETYRDFRAAPEAAPHGLFRAAETRARLIQLYSFSKAFAVPGHRVGALIAPAPAMAEIGKVLDCIQICAPRAAQSAIAWAIPALKSWRQATSGAVARRSALFAEAMRAAPDWQIEAMGAYFAYVRHPFPDQTSVEVARQLATETGVLALPGSYFGPGQEGFLRFAYANTDDAGAAATGARIARHAPRT